MNFYVFGNAHPTIIVIYKKVCSWAFAQHRRAKAQLRTLFFLLLLFMATYLPVNKHRNKVSVHSTTAPYVSPVWPPS
jgi:hypothetical protein